MIFLFVGCFLAVIGISFSLFPSKKTNLLYGYRSVLAEKSEEHWIYAQKISGRMFLLTGLLMGLIGVVLKYFGWTNFFLIEMFLLVFPIMPIFLITEKKLREFDKRIDKKRIKADFICESFSKKP